MRLSLKDNCLSFALRRLNQEGGWVVCRRSGYSRKGMHVHHESVDGEISNYVPKEPLSSPWWAFLGFDGVVSTQDEGDLAGPVSLTTMFLGAWVLALGTNGWVALQASRKFIKSVKDHSKGLFAKG